MLMTRHQAIFSRYENDFTLGLIYLKETFCMQKKKNCCICYLEQFNAELEGFDENHFGKTYKAYGRLCFLLQLALDPKYLQ